MLWNNEGYLQFKTFNDMTEENTPLSIEWSTGNIGIGSYLGVGTYEPTARLHVLGNSLLDGNLNLTGNTVLDGSLNVAGNTNLKGTSTVSFQNTDINKSMFTINGGKNFGNKSYATLLFRANANSASTGPAGRIVASRPTPTFTDATMTFQTIGAGSSFVNTMSLRGGKVGIGTTNPSKKLHVEGDTLINGKAHIKNVMKLEPLDTEPFGSLGEMYVSTDGNLYFHDGMEWRPVSLGY